VADDFEPWRRFVMVTLHKHAQFSVIAEVSDGLEAVQQAQQLQPDLIVLDIGLPTLNGIEAARQIRQLSPSSKIVFLSENRSSDIVEEAVRSGAIGYVFKTDAASALLPAVEAVLRGQQFLSASLDDHDRAFKDEIPGKIVTLQQPYNPDATSRHPVDFYAEDLAFVDAFSTYIETALAHGKVAVVIASEAHHASIRQRLRSSGVDVDAVAERKYYIPLNLADSLSRVEGASDMDRLATDADFRTLEEIGAAEQRQLHVAVG
jgi:DNA-binding NarL/FixJ family response regulator